MHYKNIIQILGWTGVFICSFYLALRYIDFDTDETIVAVLDTGVDYNHELLEGKVIKGMDFSSFDFDPMDEEGHGTHVAGTILEIAPNAKILPLRLIDKEEPLYFDLVIPILSSIVRGADVINMSFSGKYSPITQWVIDLGIKKDVVFVASTGNYTLKNDIEYPAKYKGVIAVAAYDEKRRAIYKGSNLGDNVDFIAPGVNVESADLENTYSKKTGTSMSSAHVSGLLAKMITETDTEEIDLYQALVKSSNEFKVGDGVYRAIEKESLKANGTNETYIWHQGVKQKNGTSYDFNIKTVNARHVTIYVDGELVKEADGDLHDNYTLNFEDGVHEVVTVAERIDAPVLKERNPSDTGEMAVMQYPVNEATTKNIVDVQRLIIDTVNPKISLSRKWIEGNLLMIIGVEDFTLKDIKITLNKKTLSYQKEALGNEKIYLPVKPNDFPVHIEAEDYNGNASQLQFDNARNIE